MHEDFVEEFENYLTNILDMPNEKRLHRLKVAREYLKCAKDDLRAAEILHKNKLHALAVYHLQQAIEKASKTIAIASFSISPEEVKDINHKSPIAFIKMVQSMPIIRLVKLFNAGIRTDIENLEETIKKKSGEILKSSKEEIDELLDFLENYKSSINNEEVKTVVEELIIKPLKIDIKLDSFPEMANGFIDLYVLSCITYPHWMSTRYSDQSVKPDDYRDGLGIFDCFEKLLRLSEKSIKSIEKYLSLVIRNKGD